MRKQLLRVKPISKLKANRATKMTEKNCLTSMIAVLLNFTKQMCLTMVANEFFNPFVTNYSQFDGQSKKKFKCTIVNSQTYKLNWEQSRKSRKFERVCTETSSE